MSRFTRFQALTASLIAGAAALGGCSSGPETVSYSAVRGNLTPEMRGVTDTVDESEGWWAYLLNMNARMTVDDFKRTFYLDHPSRLDPRPLVDISGNPR